MRRPRTLRGRLSLYYGIVLAAIVIAYSGAVYILAVDHDDRAESQAEEREEAEGATRRLLLALGLGLPVALALAAAGGLWLVRRALQPIEDVVRVAGDLGAESLERRIPLQPGAAEEVALLVATLNAMLERIHRSVEGIRRFTADASHELRTPLAVMMGDIEVALRQPREVGVLRATMEETLEGLGQLARLAELLLTLARADARELPIQRASSDASEVARQVVEAFADIAADRGVTLTGSYAGAIEVHADSLWLSRALVNLVDNACKFTPRGGAVHVSVEDLGKRVHIAVTDTGPGLTEDEAARAFDRFYRGTSARASAEGFGLGLPLARDIVRALGGEVHVARVEAGGARFWVDLPTGR